MGNNMVIFIVTKSKKGILACISEPCSNYRCLASYQTPTEPQALYLRMLLAYGKCEYIWFSV